MGFFGRKPHMALPPPDFPVEKATPTPFAELGNAGLYRNTGGLMRADEFLPNLRGRRASETYKEMRLNDAVVAGVLFAIDSSLRAVEWHVESSSDAPADMDVADFVKSCMDDMSGTWPDFVSDALTMLPYGHSVVELVYKRRDGDSNDPSKRSRYNDGRIGWRKLSLLPQETLTKFILDEHGGVQGVEQQTGSGPVVVLPIEKALLFRTTHSSPWGQSVLRTAYRAYYFKKRIENTEAIGIERDLAGLPMIVADADYLAAHRDELQRIVTNVRNDEQAGVLFPGLSTDSALVPLVELRLLSSGGSRQFDTDRVVARYNRAIATSLLQDVLLLGHEKVGTQALAVEKRDLSDLALKAWLQEMAAVLNAHAVPRLLRLNGMPVDAPPRICHGEISPIDATEFAGALKTVVDAGWQGITEPGVDALIRRRLGLPPAEEGEG